MSYRWLALPLAAIVVAACSAGAEDDGTGSSETSNSGPGGTGANGFGGGSTASSGFDGEECGSVSAANAVPASVLVVLDKSGSMSGDDDTPDKWGPTKAALTAMTQNAAPDLRVGLSPFPKGDFNWSGQAGCYLNPSGTGCAEILADGGCQDVYTTPAVAVDALSVTGAQIVSWLNANSPDGNTPTLGALEAAYEHMRVVDAQGERYVLLITDGDPTVHTPAQTIGPLSIPESNIECKQVADIEAAASAAAVGSPVVKTFVIGSPGVTSSGQTFLSQVAINGLTAPDGCVASSQQCHFQIGSASFQTDLQAVLDQIAGQISDCIFALPTGDDVDPNKVNVKIETANGEVEVYRNPSHESGWDYTDGSQTKIQLFGQTCEDFKATKGNEIVIVLGCVTVVQ